MSVRPLTELMAPDWAQALADQQERIIAALCANWPPTRLPAAATRCCGRSPSDADVKCCWSGRTRTRAGALIGQASRWTPGCPLPRSLVNIYRELHDDLGVGLL